MKRGRFITLEGCEGAGKSTNLAWVQTLVERAGHTAVVTREPGGTPFAEEIRALLLAVRDEPVAPDAELLLMFAARAQHLACVIRPALAHGTWVICDRFTDATYAYQGGGRGMDEATIAALERVVHPDLQPDLTLYLDITARQAAGRIRARDHDRFELEGAPFFEAVRAAYRARAAIHARFVVIDAGAPVAAVRGQIEGVLRRFIEEAAT